MRQNKSARDRLLEKLSKASPGLPGEWGRPAKSAGIGQLAMVQYPDAYTYRKLESMDTILGKAPYIVFVSFNRRRCPVMASGWCQCISATAMPEIVERVCFRSLYALFGSLDSEQERSIPSAHLCLMHRRTKTKCQRDALWHLQELHYASIDRRGSPCPWLKVNLFEADSRPSS